MVLKRRRKKKISDCEKCLPNERKERRGGNGRHQNGGVEESVVMKGWDECQKLAR